MLVIPHKDYFDAFEEMGENFTFEGGEEGLEARQEAFENFVKEMGNLTKELIMNWVKEKIEHALIRAAMVDTEKESQDEMSDVSKEGLESEGDIAKKAGKKTLSEIGVSPTFRTKVTLR